MVKSWLMPALVAVGVAIVVLLTAAGVPVCRLAGAIPVVVEPLPVEPTVRP